jgi:hypothetical protein
VEVPVSVSCLEQAEICREQARDAARLRRFKAALGLFATAAALCKRALTLTENDESFRSLAMDRLRQIEVEIATYTDLARAMERSVV